MEALKVSCSITDAKPTRRLSDPNCLLAARCRCASPHCEFLSVPCTLHSVSEKRSSGASPDDVDQDDSFEGHSQKSVLQAKLDAAHARRKAQLQSRRDTIAFRETSMAAAIAKHKNLCQREAEQAALRIRERQQRAAERREQLLSATRKHRQSKCFKRQDSGSDSEVRSGARRTRNASTSVSTNSDDFMHRRDEHRLCTERFATDSLLEIVRRAPPLLRQLQDCGLSESPTDYSSSASEESSPQSHGSQRNSAHVVGSVRFVVAADDGLFHHHLHLAPRRVEAILRNDAFLPCSMCRRRQPQSAVCPADPARRHKSRLAAVAESLLGCLIVASDTDLTVDRLQLDSTAGLFLSAFVAAAQYRDDSFGEGQAALDVLAHVDEQDAPGTACLSSCAAAERAINKEAARLVNALYFIQDRLALLSAVPAVADSALDLPEQVGRFALGWRRFRRLSLVCSDISRDHRAQHGAALRRALRTLQLRLADSTLDRSQDNEEEDNKPAISAARTLRKEKCADLMQGIKEQLAFLGQTAQNNDCFPVSDDAQLR
jgi:hypothetical protein